MSRKFLTPDNGRPASGDPALPPPRTSGIMKLEWRGATTQVPVSCGRRAGENRLSRPTRRAVPGGPAGEVNTQASRDAGERPAATPFPFPASPLLEPDEVARLLPHRFVDLDLVDPFRVLGERRDDLVHGLVVHLERAIQPHCPARKLFPQHVPLLSRDDHPPTCTARGSPPSSTRRSSPPARGTLPGRTPPPWRCRSSRSSPRPAGWPG